MTLCVCVVLQTGDRAVVHGVLYAHSVEAVAVAVVAMKLLLLIMMLMVLMEEERVGGRGRGAMSQDVGRIQLPTGCLPALIDIELAHRRLALLSLRPSLPVSDARRHRPHEKRHDGK